MKQKRLLLIVNPISGTHSKAKLVPKLEAKLSGHGFDVTTRYTTKAGDATSFAAEAAAEGFDVVAVCGGDGTVNETAKALCGSGVPMAIIPAGSGNGLARHIGLSSDALAAVDVISDENIHDCDYAEVNGTKFFCTFGMGFDGAVAENFANDGHRGKLTYVKTAITTFFKYNPQQYTISIDGHDPIDRKAYVVAVCNASQYGNNAFIAPGASVKDGMLDVVIMRDASRLRTLKAGLDMMLGTLKSNGQMEVYHAKMVDIKAVDKPHTHIDGEPVQIDQQMHVQIIPGKLRLYTDLANEHFKPLMTPLRCVGRDIACSLKRLFLNS